MSAAWRVDFSTHAGRQLRKLDPTARLAIIAALESLALDPHAPNPNVKPLRGEDGRLRLRVGDYRVVYDLYDDELVVWVIKLGHRKQVYDR